MATPKSKKRRKIIIFTVIGLVLVALTLVAVFKKREPVITIQTEKVARRNLTETVVANGRIQPVVQVKISAEVSGEIIELPVKEGQPVKKGDLLAKIKPDAYIAALNQANAGYQSALAGQATAEANLEKAEADFKRNKELFEHKLLSESDFIAFKAARNVAKAQRDSAVGQIAMAKAAVASAKDSLDKTAIVSPLTGTVSKLSLQAGERVAGNTMMAGTEIMTVADLNDMEARVDVGENDVVLSALGQKASLEVDAFRDRKFKGTVTDIANSSGGVAASSSSSSLSSSSGDATKFQVKIRIGEKEAFRPGMSVTAEIETRSRTNVLTVPLASVTTRLPKEKEKKDGDKKPGKGGSGSTNLVASAKTNAAGAVTNVVATTTNVLTTATNELAATTNVVAATTNVVATATNALGAATNVGAANATNAVASGKKAKEAPKPQEVVFVLESDRVKRCRSRSALATTAIGRSPRG